MEGLPLTRRAFVAASLSASGGLAVGVAWPGTARAALVAADIASQETAVNELNAFLEIDPDGAVTFRCPHCEMGQGAATALAMIVAEELECDWLKLKVEYASANRNARAGGVYGNMLTTGSIGVRGSREALQQAGASARARLIAVAARRWRADPADCEARRGQVTHTPTGRSLAYGALAEDATRIKLAEEPAIKQPGDFRLIGQRLPRVDSGLKITGGAKFAIDVQLPGMVHAAIRQSPVFGGTLKSVDDAKIKGRRGIIQVVKLDDAVAVVADRWWRAKQAVDELAVEWESGIAIMTDSAQFKQLYRGRLDGDMTAMRNDGDVDAELGKAAKTVDALYEAPYLAHAQMEPLAAAADVRPDKVEVWVGSQYPMGALELAAKAAGVAPDKVFVHNQFLGGGFGRRSRNDELVHAVLISKAVGKPVKLVRSREEDMTHDRYRPMAAVRFQAALGPDGLPAALDCRVAVGSINRMSGFELPPSGIEPQAVSGIASTSYRIPNLRVAAAHLDTHVPVFFWRSVGNSQNAFFIESFIDELAVAASQDPLKYRRDLLAQRADFVAVLDLLALKGDWGKALPAGKGRGVAVHECFGTIVGQTAEVTVDAQGNVRVDRIVSVVDCGHVVNPRIVESQIESGVIFGLSAALWGAVAIKDGAAVENNFDRYRVARLSDQPRMETYFALSGGAKWGGIGEPGTPPVAPAIANAVFAATGKRIRALPLGNVNGGAAAVPAAKAG